MKKAYALYTNGKLKLAKDASLENLELLTKEAEKIYNQNKNNPIEVRMVSLMKDEDQTFGDFDGYYESKAGYEIVYDPAGPIETAKRNGCVAVSKIKDIPEFVNKMEQEGYDCWVESYDGHDSMYVKKEEPNANNENNLNNNESTLMNNKTKLINHVAKEIVADVISAIKKKPIETGFIRYGDGFGEINFEAYRTYGGNALGIALSYFDTSHLHWYTNVDGVEWHAKVFFNHDGDKTILSAVFVDDPEEENYLIIDVLDSPVFTNKYDEEYDDIVCVYDERSYYKQNENYAIRL